MEHKIIAAITANRDSFDRIASHVTREDFSPEGWQVFKAVKRFYAQDQHATRADLEIIQSTVTRTLTNHKHNDMFEVYFQNVKSHDVSAVNVVNEVLAVKREAVSLALADAILAKQEDQVNRALDQLVSLRASEVLETSVVEEYQGLSVAALAEELDNRHLIRVLPRSLNQRLGGGVLRGHHILVAARPEAGKTAIVLTMMKGFVVSGHKVLYVGNEDPTKDIVMRFITCLSGMNKAQVLSDYKMAEEKARERGYDKAVFAGLSGGSISDIRALCTKHRPDVLIVDQIRNISSDSENRTVQLEAVARGMRNLGREFNLVPISVTQAGDSADGKLILGMGDIDGSNTGIPGACDIMLMSGVNPSYEQQNIRMFTLCKNKASGRHENWMVSIDPQHSTIKDI